MIKRTHVSSHVDFDFEMGDWNVMHRRLRERLAGCTEWVEFEGVSSTRKVLGGYGNVEDNLLQLPGGPYRALALRSFNPKTMLWSIWWLDDTRTLTLRRSGSRQVSEWSGDLLRRRPPRQAADTDTFSLVHERPLTPPMGTSILM